MPSGLTAALSMLLQVVGCFMHADNAPVSALNDGWKPGLH
jgi:hypothetical protein